MFYCELSLKDIKMSSCRTEEKVTLNFVNRDGKSISVTALTGNSILDVVVDQNLDFDGFGKLRDTIQTIKRVSVIIVICLDIQASSLNYAKCQHVVDVGT